jgi:hypothetical protein
MARETRCHALTFLGRTRTETQLTTRSTLFLLALLLIASLAGAAGVSQAVPPTATAGTSALMAPAAMSPGCDKAELPFFTSEPLQRGTTGYPCGSCSTTHCQGSQTGIFCSYWAYGTQMKGTCQISDTAEPVSCTTYPRTWSCYCQIEPL